MIKFAIAVCLFAYVTCQNHHPGTGTHHPHPNSNVHCDPNHPCDPCDGNLTAQCVDHICVCVERKRSVCHNGHQCSCPDGNLGVCNDQGHCDCGSHVGKRSVCHNGHQCTCPDGNLGVCNDQGHCDCGAHVGKRSVCHNGNQCTCPDGNLGVCNDQGHCDCGTHVGKRAGEQCMVDEDCPPMDCHGGTVVCDQHSMHCHCRH